MILIISFTSSFEINKVNPFPTLTAPFSLIFLSNLFIAIEVKLLPSPGKSSLSKIIATLFSTFLPELASQGSKDPLDWIISIFELYYVLYLLTYC